MKFFRLTYCLVISLAASICFAQSNPAPFVNQALVPAAVTPGVPGFSFTVHGAGFVPGSIVNWNGTPLATKFISAAKLTAEVPAANVSKARTVNVTVVSPAPGGGSSNPVPFTIVEPTTELQFSALPVLGTTTPLNLVTADFNHDGIADLAVIDQASESCVYQYGAIGSLAIFLGNGDGTFTKHSTVCLPDYQSDQPQRLIVAGDVNRDGNVDLVAVSNSTAFKDLVDIYDGNGDGTFIPPAAAPDFARALVSTPFQNIRGLALGDFEGNGQLYIAESEDDDFGFYNVLLIPRNGDLVSSPIAPTGPLNAGDFNGDGLLDLADGTGPLVGNGNGSSLEMFRNAGNGNFTQQPVVPFGTGESMVSGDFNGDGILDVATTNGNTISVLLGNGDGSFSQKDDQPTSAQTNVALITADFNGDGKLDLAVIDSTNVVSIWLGNGDGTFQAPVDSTGRGDGAVAADFNGDGRMDLAVTNSTSATVTVLLQATAAAPTFSVSSGSYPSGTSVILSTTTSGCSSYIDWGTSNPPHNNSGSFSVLDDATIYAYVHGCPGFTDSHVVSETFTVSSQAAAPTFSIPSGTYPSGTPVTLSTVTSSCSSHIYWGTSNPPSNHSTSFSVLANATVYAYVHGCPGFADSHVASENFTVSTQAAAPTFSVPSGSYPSGTSVTLSTVTSSCSSHIYWGTSNPPSNHSTSFSVLANGTINAYVHGCPGFADSHVVSETFTVSPHPLHGLGSARSQKGDLGHP